MRNPDLIDVVSASDVPTTHLRIEKAFQRYHDSQAGLLVLNGFNTADFHDADFEGETWRDDVRLVDIYRELDPLYPVVLYARNTVENGLRLRKFMYGNLLDSETVTSRTHMPRLKMIYGRVFPQDEFDRMAFSASEEPKGTYLPRLIKEAANRIAAAWLLSGIERGDWRIDKEYAERRYSKKNKPQAGFTLAS
jgi:hypothetical protein